MSDSPDTHTQRQPETQPDWTIEIQCVALRNSVFNVHYVPSLAHASAKKICC